MLSVRVQQALNNQVNLELQSSYAYLAMSAYCELQNFVGSAKWLRIQSQEENEHAMKIFDFLVARECPVVLQDITAPCGDFSSIPDVFQASLEQEQQVSQSINQLYELAHEEKAFAALVELQWFITEQVEEEKTVREIVAKFRMVKDDPSAMLDLDRELGDRVAEETTSDDRN